MRLTSARLHPFGRFADRTFDLDRSLVVIHGPNEEGKSTLRQAIFHALFTPTKLTKTKFEDSVGRWVPLPAGDFAQVQLVFEHDSKTWTLEKRWGAEPGSQLSDGTTPIADPVTVQAKLGEMLTHGEATFRHVLFTGQAELEQTIATIQSRSGELRDIRDLVSAAAGAADDVDEQKLRRLLESKITAAFGRWDESAEKPERQSGREKGIHDPWKRDVGDILAAWYAWQTAESERAEVLAIESELDDVAARVTESMEQIRHAAEFVETYGCLRDALSQRSVLEERLPRLDEKVAKLNAAFAGWPKAQAAIDGWGPQKKERELAIERLSKERADAEAKKAGTEATKAFGRISTAKRDWEVALAKVADHPAPASEQVSALEKLERDIAATENKIASRQLAWRIVSDEPATVTIARGTGAEESLTVGTEVLTGTAEARVTVAGAGLTLTVESGGDDVESLFKTLADDREALKGSLEACGVPTVSAAKLEFVQHHNALTEANTKKQVYESQLAGKPFECWAEEIAALARLPETRALAAIDDELNSARTQLAEGNASVKGHDEAIAEWKRLYTDVETLTEQLLDARSVLKTTKEELAGLPALPEGFETPRALLDALEAANNLQVTQQRRLTEDSSTQASLTAKLADRRSEDLAEVTDAAKRRFERARAKGRDYRRILEELDRIAAGSASDPLAKFSAKVEATFSRITGQQTRIAFDGQLPAGAERGGVRVPPDRLSFGAGGALALSLRLAMAEAYLDGGPAFLMLDDPLVNFDTHRLAEAAAVLRAFSERAQVIYFTCHDMHAERLQSDPDATVGGQ